MQSVIFPKESGRIQLVDDRGKPRIILYLATSQKGHEDELAVARRELIVMLNRFPSDAYVSIDDSLKITIVDRRWWVKPFGRRARKTMIDLLTRLYPLHGSVVELIGQEFATGSGWMPTVKSTVDTLLRAELLAQSEALESDTLVHKLVDEISGGTSSEPILEAAREICGTLREKLIIGDLSPADQNDLKNSADAGIVERWAKKYLIRSMRVARTCKLESPLSLLQKEFMKMASFASDTNTSISMRDFVSQEIDDHHTGEQTIALVVTHVLAKARHLHGRLESLLWRLAHWKVDQFHAQWAASCSVNEERLLVHLKEMQTAALRAAKMGVEEFAHMHRDPCS